jgi:hypothetical protein
MDCLLFLFDMGIEEGPEFATPFDHFGFWVD